MTRPALALAVVACVLLAGCASLPGGGTERGTVSVYVSDQENAIGDFAHLNVTVTEVGLKRAGGWRGDHGAHDHRHRNRWVVYDVPDQRVDLTRLQGENATLLDNVSVANGTYEKVFIHVTAVDGTLKNASGNATVRVPRDRLKVKKRFTVSGGESISFVFDVTVVERSDGEYVVKPHVAESGVDQSFCRCGRGGCGGEWRNETKNKSSGGGGGSGSGSRGGGGGGCGCGC